MRSLFEALCHSMYVVINFHNSAFSGSAVTRFRDFQSKQLPFPWTEQAN